MTCPQRVKTNKKTTSSGWTHDSYQCQLTSESGLYPLCYMAPASWLLVFETQMTMYRELYAIECHSDWPKIICHIPQCAKLTVPWNTLRVVSASAPKPSVLPWVPPAIGNPVLIPCPSGNPTPRAIWVGVYRAWQGYSGMTARVSGFCDSRDLGS